MANPDKSDKPPVLTAREKEILVAAILSHKNPFDLDYTLLAQKAGFKNANTARTQFSPIKRKILALGAALPSATVKDEKTNTDTGSAKVKVEPKDTGGRKAGTSRSARKRAASTEWAIAKRRRILADEEGEGEDADGEYDVQARRALVNANIRNAIAEELSQGMGGGSGSWAGGHGLEE
ncbi:hypothetical protein ANO11243_075000 [Dothideomycetidae sp. 11243]|nr:hypothetical protein ANO11243_075000 [fungal sp. No.11243]